MKKGLFSGATHLLTGLVFAAGLHVQAAIHFVGVDGSGFFPATLEIDVGDTVVWVNFDDTFSHTTTSDLSLFNPNYWNGFLVDEFDTFGKTFNNLGTFTYYDQLDIGTGTIVVSVPAPPGIVLESPRIESGQFLFDATGLTVGKSNVLESSINLTNWTSLSTNVAADVSMTFTNTINASRRFYRLFELP